MWGFTPYSVSMLLLLFPFAITDLAYRRIPKHLNHLVLLPAWLIDPKNAIVIYFLYFSIFRLSRGAIGYGDVRFAPITVILSDLSGTSPFAPHLLAWVIGGLFAVFRLSSDLRLPFAPFISLGAALTASGNS